MHLNCPVNSLQTFVCGKNLTSIKSPAQFPAPSESTSL